MSSEDHEPLSPNKALVPYYKTSIVPPDVISRIKRESSTIEAKIRANLDNVQNKKHIAYLLIGVTVVAVSLLLHIVAGLIAGGILAFISRDHLLPEQEASFDRDQKSFATSAARTTFHCPHCSKSFNAAAPWLCGNCGNLHEQTKENRFKYSSPFIECKSVSCSQRKQVAIQCPNNACSRHILLDHQRYVANRSHNTPYLGVARFQGDDNKPQVPENFSADAFTDIFN